jgi:subtilisin family serine protease
MSRRTGTGNPRKHHLRALLQVERLEERNLLTATPQAWIAVVPSDPYFSYQYGLKNGNTGADIGAEAAWNVSTGSMKTVVGIVDTGIDYNHPDLYLNVWVNQAEIPDFWYTKSSASSTTYNKIVYKTQVKDVDGDGLITFRDLNSSVNAGLVWDNNGDGVIDAGDLLRPMSQGGWNSGSTKDGDTAHPDDFFGWNFINNTNNPLDDNGHGTHVAGIIGASGNNGVGVTGVNWQVSLMALKFIDSTGSGSAADAVSAINYSVLHGAIVTNNSWAMGNAYWQPLYDAMNNAQQHGQVIVAAAGNGNSSGVGMNNDATPDYPGSFNLPNIIAVAATGPNDTLTSFSNYGPTTVDLAAPGLNILSTYPNKSYQYLSGTSMATPYVTGAVALVHTVHPTWTGSQIVQQIESSVDKIPALAGKVATGGRLDLAQAVGTSRTAVSGPQITSLTANGPSAGPISSVRVTFNQAIDLTTFTTADIDSFTGPNGSIVATGVQAVSGSGNKQFDITFAKQTTPGNYTIVIGPNIKDTSGLLMDQNRNGISGEATADRYTGKFAINSTSTWITGGVRINESTTTIVSQVVSSDITIAKMNVFLTLTFGDLSKLTIQVKGPDGTTVTLFNGHGGTNLQQTTFDDSASTAIGSGTAPYTGSFRPDSPLSVFNGKDAKGTWQLIITNHSGAWGRDNLFTLNFEQAPAGSASSIASKADSGTTVDASPATVASVQSADAGDVVNRLVIDARHQEEIVNNPVRTFDVKAENKQESVTTTTADRLRDLALSQGGHANHDAKDADVSLDSLMTFFESLGR